tara:strand:- start:664 stop:882 length:219 start_codon:yes stop_codon:yes gene_type:complete
MPVLINFFVMPRGTVKFFNESKGYGFIKSAETNQDIFVHVSGLNHKVNEGDNVTFEVKEGKRGLNAVNVQAE